MLLPRSLAELFHWCFGLHKGNGPPLICHLGDDSGSSAATCSLPPAAHLPSKPLTFPFLLFPAQLCFMTTSRTMFYGPSSTMAPPSKNRLKRQSRLFSQVLYRTLSYKDRSSASASPAAAEDDPAELSTQLSAPGILKIFGGNICAGTNYKSVLVMGSSGARELVKEALERYGLSQLSAGQYALCDVIGRFQGPEKQWQTEGLRVLGDHEKPLLIQDLWKPREGFSRRLELRRRAEVEEMAAKDVDTTTAGQSWVRGRERGWDAPPETLPHRQLWDVVWVQGVVQVGGWPHFSCKAPGLRQDSALSCTNLISATSNIYPSQFRG